jgi:hypothetical protein
MIIRSELRVLLIAPDGLGFELPFWSIRQNFGNQARHREGQLRSKVMSNPLYNYHNQTCR